MATTEQELLNGIASLRLPEKIVAVHSGEADYRGAYGGRGSGKTRGFALMSAVRGMMFGLAGVSGVILCAREHLNSLDESSMAEVKQAILSEPWLAEYWEIGEKYIRSKDGRIRYVFAGLRQNVDSIKSKARILIAWIDEAENVSELAWSKLEPTVREEGSEIWATWNPESAESATHKRWRKFRQPRSRLVSMNWRDNPFFPKVLNRRRLADLQSRPDTYDHVWEGEFLTRTKAQIFAGKYELRMFNVSDSWDGPYYGCDFGFSQDPTTFTEMYVAGRDLMIRRDCGKVGLELDDTAEFARGKMPGIAKHPILADSARPETISYLKRNGLPRIKGVKKWAGSVEDGIEFMKSFRKIIVHETDAPGNAREMRVYSYKVDRLTEEVTDKIIDANNHYVDADRYGLTPIMQRHGYNLMDVL